MNPVPFLSDEERRESMEKATAMRRSRAALRDQLKQGRLTLADVLADEGDAAQGMRVEVLLRSLPGYGKARAEALMRKVGIAPSRRVRGLGARQRERLLDEVHGGRD